jgi:hypothetical protein
MRTNLALCTFAIVLGVGVPLGACTADIHGNTINATIPTTVTFTTSADVNNVKPGDSLPCHAQTDQPSGSGSTSSSSASTTSSSSSTSSAAPDAGPVMVADAGSTAPAPAPAPAQESVLFQIFIDDDSGSPLFVTAQADFSVTVPAKIAAGSHKVICRVAHSDGTATEVTSSFNITVVTGAM